MKQQKNTYSAKVVAVGAVCIGFLTACNACEFLALANSVITVRLVGFILLRGTPSSGRLRVKFPAKSKHFTQLISNCAKKVTKKSRKA